MNPKKLKVLLYANVVFNLLIYTIGIFTHSSFFWGFNFLSYFNVIQIIVFLTAGYIILIPKYQELLLGFIQKINELIKKDYLPIIIIILYSIFFSVFRLKVHFLGDGPMILRMLPEMTNVSDMITTNEPGAYAVDLFVQTLLRKAMGESYNANYVYLVLSYISGIIFLLVLLKFVNLILKDAVQKIFTFLLLFFSGAILFYTGYVETYQIVYLCIFIYTITSILFLKDKAKNTFIASIVFGFWLSLHYLAAVYLPSYLILLYSNYKKNKYQTFISIGLALSCFVLGFIFTGLELNEMISRFFAPNEPHWLPLFSNLNQQVIPAASIYHLWDIINSQILVLPFGLFTLLAFFIIYYKKINWKNHSYLFLLSMALFSFIFIFLFNSHLGLSRDWDVIALMSFPFLIFTVLILNDNFDFKNINRIYFSITYISVWQTIIWIFLNWNVNISEARNTNLNNDKLWEKNKIGLYFEEVGSYYRNKGDYNQAEIKYNEGLKYTPENLRIIINLSGVYQKLNKNNEAESILENTFNNGIYERKVIMNLGILEIKLGNYDKAIMVFEKSLQKDSNDYEALGNIAGAYYLKKEYRKSIEYSNKVINIIPDLALPHISLGDSYLAIGDTLNAYKNYQIAKNLDKEYKYKNEIEIKLNNLKHN